MDLYIVRHGDAPSSEDGERRLSEQGYREVRALARWLQASGVAIDRILASPYLRAQQTAKEIHRILDLETSLETEPLLVTFSDPQLTAEALRARPEPALLVVSHMPLVARLLAYLTGGNEDYFATAGIARLDLKPDADHARLVYHFSPERYKQSP